MESAGHNKIACFKLGITGTGGYRRGYYEKSIITKGPFREIFQNLRL